MEETKNESHLVQITNTAYLRLLMQTDKEYRDRYWCFQLNEHLQKMESFAPPYRFNIERKILNKTYENL